MALNRKNHANRESWDVPFSIDYIEARFDPRRIIPPTAFSKGFWSFFMVTCEARARVGPKSRLLRSV